MKQLIGEALDSEAIIEGRREMSVGKIVDKIVAELPHTEAEISEDQVSQADRDVEEIRLSESVDSEGNRLSVQQEQYFADSKVRDADGNLLVLYHGTGSEFYEFRIGDVGYHVGTKEQADIRVKDSGFDNI